MISGISCPISSGQSLSACFCMACIISPPAKQSVGRYQTHGICRPALRRKKYYFGIYSCMHSWLRHPYHPHESKQAKQPACTRPVPFGRHIHCRTLGQPFLDLVSRHDGHLLNEIWYKLPRSNVSRKHKVICFPWRILNILLIRHLNFTSQHNDGKCRKIIRICDFSQGLEPVRILSIPSGFRTWMYGKGGHEPGWRMSSGRVRHS